MRSFQRDLTLLIRVFERERKTIFAFGRESVGELWIGIFARGGLHVFGLAWLWIPWSGRKIRLQVGSSIELILRTLDVVEPKSGEPFVAVVESGHDSGTN